MDWCPKRNVYDKHYLSYAIVLPVVILCQIYWMINQIFCNYKSLSVIPKHLVSLYVLIQINGLLWTMHEFFKRVILTQIYPTYIFNDIICKSTAYSSKLFPFLNEGLLIAQILFRLTTTFKTSRNKVGMLKINRILLYSFLVIPYIVWFILFFLFLDKPCYGKWSSQIDINGNGGTLYLCYARHSKNAKLIGLLGAIWIASANLLFGFIFSKKLYVLLAKYKHHDNGNENDLSVEKIMVKNTIL
eukprot:34072_1